LTKKPLALLLFALLGLNLLAWFATPAADTDFWWHLRTGQFITETRTLPVPDPFSYTANTTPDLYPGEKDTRHFNLTHEWLAQVGLYGLYLLGGFPAIILCRSLVLALTAACAGLLAWRRSQSAAWAVFATLACGLCLYSFTSDRPTLLTPLLTGVVLLILEFGWPLWLLPPLFLVWANLHGGFVMGGFVVAVYLLQAWKSKAPTQKPLFRWGAAAALACGLNPNLWGVVTILGHYRQSPLTAALSEWMSPNWIAPPYVFQLLTLALLPILAYAWRRVRLSDVLIGVIFCLSAWSAFRNIPFFALVAPMLLATYWPFKTALPQAATAVTAALLALLLGAGAATGQIFRLRADTTLRPEGAIQFLLDHHLPGPVINSYANGGYFLWRAWPQYKSFVDGRALSEVAYQHHRIVFGAFGEGANEQRLSVLQHYKAQTILTEGYQTNGGLYPLVTWLQEPAQENWQLLFEDDRAMIFSLTVPPGVTPLPRERIYTHLEKECALLLAQPNASPACARSIGLYLGFRGNKPRARYWLEELRKRTLKLDEASQKALADLEAQP